MEKYEFPFKFYWIFFPGPNQQYSNIGSDNGLAPAGRQAIIWSNGGYFMDAYMRQVASMS